MNLDRELIFSCVEEDNIQRAYFRIHPLLTASGSVVDEAAQMWPNEGCLRIVPDRGEQHTFKERMRALNGWCVVDLTAFPPEANKIRTNKNFHPDRGEINQFILYSDAVMPAPSCVFYEVLDGTPEAFDDLAKSAVTPRFFIRSDDTLYGPVDRGQPIKPDTASEAEAVLYSIKDPHEQEHTILCIASEMETRPKPVARTFAAKPVKPLVQSPAQPAVTPANAAVPAAEAKPIPETTPVADAPAPAASVADEALPIGQELKILDGKQSFEETLSGLNQPVSSGANLLHGSTQEAAAAMRPKEPAAPLSGTPLYRAPMHTSIPQPKNKLQEVVAAQCRIVRNDPPCAPLPSGCALKQVDNPVEDACTALKRAWAVPEAQAQIINCILSLDGMNAQLNARTARMYSTSPLQQAIQNRLQDLEAERLTALVQLDKAKADLEAYRKSAMAAAAEQSRHELEKQQAKQDELQATTNRLKEEINLLIGQRDELNRQVDTLSSGQVPERIIKLLTESAMTIPLNGMPLRLSPISGQQAALEEMLARIEMLCSKSNVAFVRNRVIALLVAMTVSSRLGLVSPAPAAVATLIRGLCAVMGWNSSFAQQTSPEQRPLVAGAPEDGTPAVLLTSLSYYAPLAGVRKLLLARAAAPLTRNASYETEQWPILPMGVTQFVPEVSVEPASPISMASLQALLQPGTIPDEHIDRVLAPVLTLVPPLSGRTKIELRQFVSACAAIMEGGLAAACDWAILLWVLPALERTQRNVAQMKPLLAEYPVSAEAL